MLTESERARYEEDGFLTIEGVFDADEIEALREATNHPRIQQDLRDRRADERVVHLIELAARLDVFRELATDRRITERVAHLIGDDVQLQHSKLATKPKKLGAGAFEWHQDFAYYPHTNFDLLSVSILLDDATPDNGGMYAVRGSHREGLVDHSRDGWMVGGAVAPRSWEERPERVVPLMAKAGGITIHHCLLLHGSPENRSGEPRRMIVYAYRAGHAYQLADHTWEDTGYQVHGTPGRRVKMVPMEMPLPKNKGWLRHCGDPHGSVYKQIGETAKRWNARPAAVPA